MRCGVFRQGVLAVGCKGVAMPVKPGEPLVLQPDLRMVVVGEEFPAQDAAAPTQARLSRLASSRSGSGSNTNLIIIATSIDFSMNTIAAPPSTTNSPTRHHLPLRDLSLI